jgi:HD-like signal output (HDOD) protein
MEGKIETLDKIMIKILRRFKFGDLNLSVHPKVVQEIQRVMSQPNASVNTIAEHILKRTGLK